MHTVTGDVDLARVQIGARTIEMYRDTPTAGWWNVTVTEGKARIRRTHRTGNLAAKDFRQRIETALRLSKE